MPSFNKKSLSERDICTKFITPAITKAGWDLQTQVREEVSFTKGRVIVRGKTHSRGKSKRADYILYHKPNIPLAIIEAKDNTYSTGAGMQQALEYAGMMDVPFVFSSSGDGFLFHDRTVTSGKVETELSLEAFPSPKTLWQRYCQAKGLGAKELPVVEQDFFSAGTDKPPRYYQLNAINRTAANETPVIVECRGKREDAELELAFRRVCDGTNVLGKPLPFRLVMIAKASNSVGLQMADLMARPVGLHHFRPQQPNRAFEIIQPKLRRSPAGKIEGWGLKVIP